MAQQYAGLSKQSMNLQQKQLDLNTDIHRINAITQSIQAGAQLLQAGVSVFNAIDNRAKQKEIEQDKKFRSELEIPIAQAIQRGDVTIDENGNYTGLDNVPEIKAIKEKYLNGIDEEMGGWKTGNADRAKTMLEQTFSDLNNAAYRIATEKSYTELTNSFKTNVKTGIEEAIKNPNWDNEGYDKSISHLEKTFKQAAEWMRPEALANFRAEAEEAIKTGRIENKTITIAQSQGMKAANTYLSEQVTNEKINKTQEATISLNAQKARDIAVKPEQDRLNGIWNTKTADATSATAGNLKAVLQGQKKYFEACDNEDAYYTFMRRLDSASGGSGRSGRSESEINDYNAMQMEAINKDYENGKIGIDEAYARMFDLERTRWTIDKQEEYYKQMLNFKDPVTLKAYERFEELCKEFKVNDKVKNDLQQGLIRAFTNNEMRREDRKAYVEDAINKQIAQHMNKAGKPNVSWSERELKEQYNLSYDGKLDAYYEPVGREGKQTIEVAGADVLKQNNINYSKGKVEEAIKNTGMKYVRSSLEKNGNDETSRIFHIIKDTDGKEIKVIVGKDGKLEREDRSPLDDVLKARTDVTLSRFAEKLPDNTKVKMEEDINNARLSLRGSRAPEAVINQLRLNLSKQLGNKAKTDEGKAYIEMMIKKEFSWYER